MSQEVNALAQHGFTQSVVDELRERIAADLLNSIASKEDMMWSRGQAELHRMQQDQQAHLNAFSTRLKEVQDNQAQLAAEQQRMQNAFLNVMTKFEFVVSEIRDAIRVLPQCRAGEQPSPSPSLASTVATDCLKDESILGRGCIETDESSSPNCNTAKVLSLASALPGSPGKALHLAECLDQNVLAGVASPHRRSLPVEASSGSPMSTPNRPYDLLTVEIVRDAGGTFLGMEVSQEANALRVDGVEDDGLVGLHNAQQGSARNSVLPGDRIVEVNGVGHDPVRMLEECRSGQRILLTLVRAPATLRPATVDDQPVLQKGLRPEANIFIPTPMQERSSGTSSRSVPCPPPGLEPPQDIVVPAEVGSTPQNDDFRVNRALFS